MPDRREHFNWVAKLSRAWLIASLALLALWLAAIVAHGVLAFNETRQLITLAPFALTAAGVLVGALLVFVIYGVIQVILSAECSATRSQGLVNRLETLVGSQNDSLNRLVELAPLSDQAKSLIYRDRELEAFREAVREDLIRQDYQSAALLIDSIEKRFGADEAQRLRQEADGARRATQDEKLDQAIARVEHLIDQHDWPRAGREIQRLLRVFPGNPKVAALPERIEAGRTQHKRELLRIYGEAVRKNDIDAGIDLLRQLDKYLTPQEAAALQESARGVFRAKLHNLGVQFAIKVTEQNWAGALAVGEQIIGDYPNTRMAYEVREKMDMLRSRASSR